MSNSGNGSATDSTGHFKLIVPEKDSIWFSYLGKTTSKFFVEDIMQFPDFSISIQVSAPVLPLVKVVSTHYRLDSLANRAEYHKVFNYQKPSFHSIVKSISITGFVVDIDELIWLFNFREKRSMTAFKQRLINAEQEKFIARKFNKRIIKEVVPVSDTELPAFILRFTPGYLFAQTASEYDMKKYIKNCYSEFKKNVPVVQDSTDPRN